MRDTTRSPRPPTTLGTVVALAFLVAIMTGYAAVIILVDNYVLRAELGFVLVAGGLVAVIVVAGYFGVLPVLERFLRIKRGGDQ